MRCSWLRLRIGASDESALPSVAAFLLEQGRMKFLRPLYRALHRSRSQAMRAFAQATFERARASYHPIAAKMVAQDLGL